MKIFALLFAILALASSSLAFKNKLCALEDSKDGDNEGNRCRGFFPSWSYKADTNECVYFEYHGCHGNDNRFESAWECEELCKE